VPDLLGVRECLRHIDISNIFILLDFPIKAIY
jgi:hypothetical protein